MERGRGEAELEEGVTHCVQAEYQGTRRGKKWKKQDQSNGEKQEGRKKTKNVILECGRDREER